MEQIKYQIAKTIITKLLRASLITQEEFERADKLNKMKYGICN